jgi:hypothetical protein
VQDKYKLGGKGSDVRILLTSIFLLYLAIGQEPLALGQSGTVNLDAPGALDELARDNPRHYNIVTQIMSRWLPARFDSYDVGYGPPLLLATYPPKRRLSTSFKIDDTRYSSTITVTVTNSKPKLILVK